ncbi:GNAT family N-acetyltransferase [Patescibacteria group bacterium]|nr:GNAT family N-acetyltransferase [Patescibacteria group bacterium]
MIKVRNFNLEDIPPVAKLIPQLTQNILDPESLEKRMEEIITSPRTRGIVAEDEGKIVGFAELAWYIIPSKGLIAWVEEVVVDEQARGKGVGRTLTEKLLEIAKELGCRQIKLTVSNFAAIKLYESLDFNFKETEVMIKNL